METLTLKLNRNQLHVIYDALIEACTSADSRCDEMAEHIETVNDAYWISELVEAKIKETKALEVRRLIREAINKSTDFDWNSLSDSPVDKLSEDIKTALRVGVESV